MPDITPDNSWGENSVAQELIDGFVDKHDPSEQQQMYALTEELGELAEALNTGAADEAVAEELADVIFVARTLASMRGIRITEAVNEVSAENAMKDAQTEGQKVTKSTADA
ncbi:MazG nucleotide pyrophosphohydrolase domain-containing protein [Halorubrum ezzemoulense]|uniref:MazG nucleotide pyrophosphohydrolase domain-containing protein n=1 Tax=Halorubrum ezzemoulense TaxID=337243 RepID=UPI00232D4DA6|nr:MazG nucleotide pyrophosphohydrolase domain-containing protein [Halorubrum ezzemoulense]MDB9247416.1 MazG nucleotide pyrophosphohydrolase domain-containing protein [Halorubrum ezzemoulense]MDB9258675.1 MazG nucleotide pyrophosphohydrolase domain-containing protein [Halorubrum ezzemoulense]MDB9264467.1 MazG nucleotide pyrophosphohydrolase domain-containing protein [Halorubrum ezzemoulense]MDB9269036.1 MazG nucleotide pyrophosphohydrolase domain-containing protein [Halorubrum ezzemoulense]MDB